MWKRRNVIIAVLIGLLPLFVALPAVALSTIRSNVCSDFTGPTITTPSSTESTAASSARVDGIGHPGMTVVVSNNGTGAGATVVASDGSFALDIPLSHGENAIQAREADGCQTKESGILLLLRDPLPVATPPPATPEDTADEPATNLPRPVTGLPGQEPLPSDPVPSVDTPVEGGGMPLKINTPKDGAMIYDKMVEVSGVTTPYSSVDIYVNQTIAARLTADDTGAFSAVVTLQGGNNNIYVHATAPDGTTADLTISVGSLTAEVLKEPSIAWVVPILLVFILSTIGLAIFLLYIRGWRLKHKKQS